MFSYIIVFGIVIVAMLCTLITSVYLFKKGHRDKDIATIGFGGMLLVLFALNVLIFTNLYGDFVEIKDQEDIADSTSYIVEVEVVEKVMQEKANKMVVTSGVAHSIPSPEGYWVTVSDGEFTQTLYNFDLFVVAGYDDTFKVRKIVYTNKKGEIVSQEFVLLDWSDRED